MITEAIGHVQLNWLFPSVGESIKEVEIGDWLKNEGEHVDQDDPVVVIETDKASVELPAPAAGVIGRSSNRKAKRPRSAT